VANTCRGLDASVPPEIKDVLEQLIRKGRCKRRGDYLDGGDPDPFVAPSKAYCLMELLGDVRCDPEDRPLAICRYQGLANVKKAKRKIG